MIFFRLFDPNMFLKTFILSLNKEMNRESLKNIFYLSYRK